MAKQTGIQLVTIRISRETEEIVSVIRKRLNEDELLRVVTGEDLWGKRKEEKKP